MLPAQSETQVGGAGRRRRTCLQQARKASQLCESLLGKREGLLSSLHNGLSGAGRCSRDGSFLRLYKARGVPARDKTADSGHTAAAFAVPSGEGRGLRAHARCLSKPNAWSSVRLFQLGGEGSSEGKNGRGPAR